MWFNNRARAEPWADCVAWRDFTATLFLKTPRTFLLGVMYMPSDHLKSRNTARNTLAQICTVNLLFFCFYKNYYL